MTATVATDAKGRLRSFSCGRINHDVRTLLVLLILALSRSTGLKGPISCFQARAVRPPGVYLED